MDEEICRNACKSYLVNAKILGTYDTIRIFTPDG